MAAAVAIQATNAAILDAIRNEASSQYQQRIPATTQGDISGTIAALQQYRPMMNEFVDSLVNRIGDVIIKSKIWNNPLASFKRGMLGYGSTIEEIYVGLLEAKRYDANDEYQDVFATNKPDVKSIFHSIDRQDMYQVTINEKLLQRAFTEETGLSQLVSAIMDAPYTSDYYDEYLIMRNMFTEYAKNNQFFKVQVPDPTNETNMKAAVRSMRTYANQVGFMSPRFNASNVMTHTPMEDLVVFVNTDFDAAMDVEVLASAFNMSKAEYLGKRILIDDFGIDGCQAIMADKDFFVCADTLIEFTSIYNPKALSWNYWLHHHGVYSVSKFVNAIMFTTEAGTSANTPVIALTGATLALEEGTLFAPKGEDTPLVGAVQGTVTPATDGVEVPQGLVYAISASDHALATGTFVDPEGVLHVAEHEESTEVTVTATTSYVDAETAIGSQSAWVATLVVGIDAAHTA